MASGGKDVSLASPAPGASSGSQTSPEKGGVAWDSLGPAPRGPSVEVSIEGLLPGLGSSWGVGFGPRSPGGQWLWMGGSPWREVV